jgi:hypothetical protein
MDILENAQGGFMLLGTDQLGFFVEISQHETREQAEKARDVISDRIAESLRCY